MVTAAKLGSEAALSRTERLEVYMDGLCPLCRWLREKVERRDRFNRIRWMDYRDPAVQSSTPYTFKEFDEAMRTRRITDGHWSAGYEGWLEVMRILPRWHFIVPVLSVWPFTAMGKLFYRWLAKRRYKLFGIPPPCGPEGVCSLHKDSGQ
jgi:predicted DCC family thiol-disulfide oxidoreductase YuxK